MLQQIAPQPPWTRLGRHLESAFRKALFEFDLIGNTNKIGVALSGGKDSLTLLYLLKAISGRGFPNLQITAIHVSGEFSCGSQIQPSFLKAICSQLDVELITAHQNQKKEDLSCYPCSRERRSLIFNAAREKGIEKIAFGHHQDDFIQTLLMNLFHKGEFASNLPKIKMVNYGVTIIRPLIYITEKEIISFATHYGFNRIVCRCPVGQNSMRKQTDQLLNYIETKFPNVRSNLAYAGRIYGSNKAKKP
ncbi:MAG: tRNA-cytidine(32) 2-sulfurtransferase [Chlamydiae bacterium]|nr:tRNA-cytidine(32) 2-sulfurtransferase [Chlamydiota bacterium]